MTDIVLRSRMQRLLLAERLIICLPVSIVFLLAAIAVLPIRLSPIGLVAAAGALLAVLLFRTIRISCAVNDDGVIIRNLMRSYRARWRDISKIDLGSTVHAPRHWQARSKTLRFWIGGRSVCAQACSDAHAEYVRQIRLQGERRGVDVSILESLRESGSAWEHVRRPGVVSPSGLFRVLRTAARRQAGK